jgi:hypothetical protein
MTVCIAALCNEGDEPRAIVAADRMVTLGSFIEFEHALPRMKMQETSSFAVAMVAGDTLLGTRIAGAVADAAAGSTPPMASLAVQLATRYAEARRDQIEEQLLIPRALSLNDYYTAHASLNSQIVAMLDAYMSSFNLEVELLLAGVDPSGAHIHTVHNPGAQDRKHDVIGYAAIGSGAIHALQSLIGFRHAGTADYHETVFRVYASKRRSEVAPGVGHDTDMAVISHAGVHWLTEGELAQLALIYEDFGLSTDHALKEKLDGFSLGEGTADGDDGDDD